jgi:hypothetical protein
MAYTDIDKPDEYFNTVLYTGDGNASRSVSGIGFAPDWVWVKGRSTAYYHGLWDIVRTNKSALYSNATDAEDTTTGGTLTSFDSDGFTLPNVSGGFVNNSGTTFVSWNWKANGAGVSNTAGSITSTVSANTTSGFSIVGWTGTGANGTIGHGLGTAPAMIIVKARGAVKDWMVGHNSLGWTKYINLNTTSAESTASTVWQDTAPTSSVFSVGSSSDVNTSSTTMIAYCFAEVKGYSKFGSYTGNGSTDGTFVYTGFKPAFVILKVAIGDTGQWCMYDDKRSTFNATDAILQAESSNAEGALGSNPIDFLSNGFKIRSSTLRINGSGYTFIYMAFAENPFVTSTSIPTTAR